MLCTCGKSFGVIPCLKEDAGHTLYLPLYWVYRDLMAITTILNLVYLTTHVEGMS